MANKISVVNCRVSRLFPKPKIGLKRVAEAVVGPLSYMFLFYNLHQLARAYPSFSSGLFDVRMVIILSVLAVLRSILRESLVSPIAGLMSVGLMLRFLYSSGSLTRFGVIQMQIEALTIKIKFATLLLVVLIILTAKTLQYVHEVSTILRIEEGNMHQL
jgi:hypothetical protein